MPPEDEDKPTIPAVAFRPQTAYNSAVDAEPKEIEYGTYKKLGLIKNTGQSYGAARLEAKRRYGHKADVIHTARFWVAYTIE